MRVSEDRVAELASLANAPMAAASLTPAAAGRLAATRIADHPSPLGALATAAQTLSLAPSLVHTKDGRDMLIEAARWDPAEALRVMKSLGTGEGFSDVWVAIALEYRSAENFRAALGDSTSISDRYYFAAVAVAAACELFDKGLPDLSKAVGSLIVKTSAPAVEAVVTDWLDHNSGRGAALVDSLTLPAQKNPSSSQKTLGERKLAGFDPVNKIDAVILAIASVCPAELARRPDLFDAVFDAGPIFVRALSTADDASLPTWRAAAEKFGFSGEGIETVIAIGQRLRDPALTPEQSALSKAVVVHLDLEAARTALDVIRAHPSRTLEKLLEHLPVAEHVSPRDQRMLEAEIACIDPSRSLPILLKGRGRAEYPGSSLGAADAAMLVQTPGEFLEKRFGRLSLSDQETLCVRVIEMYPSKAGVILLLMNSNENLRIVLDTDDLLEKCVEKAVAASGPELNRLLPFFPDDLRVAVDRAVAAHRAPERFRADPEAFVRDEVAAGKLPNKIVLSVVGAAVAEPNLAGWCLEALACIPESPDSASAVETLARQHPLAVLERSHVWKDTRLHRPAALAGLGPALTGHWNEYAPLLAEADPLLVRDLVSPALTSDPLARAVGATAFRRMECNEDSFQFGATLARHAPLEIAALAQSLGDSALVDFSVGVALRRQLDQSPDEFLVSLQHQKIDGYDITNAAVRYAFRSLHKLSAEAGEALLGSRAVLSKFTGGGDVLVAAAAAAPESTIQALGGTAATPIERRMVEIAFVTLGGTDIRSARSLLDSVPATARGHLARLAQLAHLEKVYSLDNEYEAEMLRSFSAEDRRSILLDLVHTGEAKATKMVLAAARILSLPDDEPILIAAARRAPLAILETPYAHHSAAAVREAVYAVPNYIALDDSRLGTFSPLIADARRQQDQNGALLKWVQTSRTALSDLDALARDPNLRYLTAAYERVMEVHGSGNLQDDVSVSCIISRNLCLSGLEPHPANIDAALVEARQILTSRLQVRPYENANMLVVAHSERLSDQHGPAEMAQLRELRGGSERFGTPAYLRFLEREVGRGGRVELIRAENDREDTLARTLESIRDRIVNMPPGPSGTIIEFRGHGGPHGFAIGVGDPVVLDAGLMSGAFITHSWLAAALKERFVKYPPTASQPIELRFECCHASDAILYHLEFSGFPSNVTLYGSAEQYQSGYSVWQSAEGAAYAQALAQRSRLNEPEGLEMREIFELTTHASSRPVFYQILDVKDAVLPQRGSQTTAARMFWGGAPVAAFADELHHPLVF